MLFGSRGGGKSVLGPQSDRERGVVYVVLWAGGKIRERKGRQRDAACARCARCATIYGAVECFSRPFQRRIFIFGRFSSSELPSFWKIKVSLWQETHRLNLSDSVKILDDCSKLTDWISKTALHAHVSITSASSQLFSPSSCFEEAEVILWDHFSGLGHCLSHKLTLSAADSVSAAVFRIRFFFLFALTLSYTCFPFPMSDRNWTGPILAPLREGPF